MGHIGSAHTQEDVEVLKAVARQRMIAVGQDELDFGDGRPRRRALPIRRSRAEHLWNALSVGFERLGFDTASGGDEVFKQLVLGRLIEPASKLETLRVLEEIGVRPCGYATVKRRLAGYAEPAWRQQIASACAAHVGLGPATLVLYDVSTLYFETDAEEGFREPGYSKQRRLEPQIHHRVVDRRAGVPVDSGGVRGQQGGDDHDHPVAPGVPGRSRPAGDNGGG